MTAISVTFTNKTAARQDPGKPITTGWGNDIWDNATFLKEWLGAGYTGGAVQNHNHDGVNSAPVNIYPQLIPNASFQDVDEASAVIGWTHTPYTGGTVATTTTVNAHGNRSLAFTSTVLANGGGESIQNDFKEIAGGNYYSYEIFYQASVANISSRCQIIWYDKDKAQISTTDIVNTTNTPTASTAVRNRVQAPATARFLKVKPIGGVPGSGTATGTVYFDGFEMTRSRYATDHVPDSITQAEIGPAAVGQSETKTSTSTVSNTTAGTNITLGGGSYGSYPQLRHSGGDTAYWGGASGSSSFAGYTNSISNVTIIYLGTTAGTAYAVQRYFTASHPYNLGYGDIQLFVFVLISKSTGKIVSTYVSPEAPWHYNGDTDIKAKYYAGGMGYKWVREIQYELFEQGITIQHVMQNGTPAEVYKLMDRLENDIIVAQPCCQKVKNNDMPVIPHPFNNYDKSKYALAVLNPDNKVIGRLAAYNDIESGIVERILYDGYLKIDNSPVDAGFHPSVNCFNASLKNTPL